jgi:uncharacterized membrane protein YdbT with pleckstrin-like domain
MGYVEKLLARNERITFVTHQHWIVLLRSLIANGFLCVLILVAVIALHILPLPSSVPFLGLFRLLPLVLLVVPFARIGLRALIWWNERYIITNRRVIQTEGVINKHVIDSSLEKVNDVVLVQSVLGRMLGYGDVEILTASEIGVNRFERIAGPVRFKTEMLNQKEDMGRLDEFGRKAGRTLEAPPPTAGDVPELIAELDELRQKGIISEQEFAQKKQELLGKI